MVAFGRGSYWRRRRRWVDCVEKVGKALGDFVFAEMKRNLIRERTKADLEVARVIGRLDGSKPKMDGAVLDTAKHLLADHTSARARSLGDWASIELFYIAHLIAKLLNEAMVETEFSANRIERSFVELHASNPSRR